MNCDLQTRLEFSFVFSFKEQQSKLIVIQRKHISVSYAKRENDIFGKTDTVKGEPLWLDQISNLGPLVLNYDIRSYRL